MHPHPTEVMSEAVFHEIAGGTIQRLTGRAQHFMHYRRHSFMTTCFVSDLSLHHGFRLQNFFLIIPARGTLFKRSRRFSLNRRIVHTHNHVCHAIRFPLILVVRPPDSKLALNQKRLGNQWNSFNFT
jgi:hypothetical protein